MKPIARNRVLASSLTGTVYFVPKAADLGEGNYRVIGKKHVVESGLTQLLEAALVLATAEGVKLEIRISERKTKRAKRKASVAP